MVRPICTAVSTLLISWTMATAAVAFVEPDGSDPWRSRVVEPAELRPEGWLVPGDRLPADLAGGSEALTALGVEPGVARLDVRSGRWATLLLAKPLLPGSGKGNSLGWESLALAGPPDAEALETVAWGRFSAWVSENREALRIVPAELDGRATVDAEGRLVRIHAKRRVSGLPVVGSALTAVIRHGNLTLFGVERWGDVRVSTQPFLDAAAAAATVKRHLFPHRPTGWRGEPRLVILPLGPAGSEAYSHRLAWELDPESEHPVSRWRAWVDAHSGELLRFFDTTHYFRQVEGGVFPISNDGEEPGGTEVGGYPMPFAEVAADNGTFVTTRGGTVSEATGTLSTALTGPFVRINDQCGVIDESTEGDVLDLGTSDGTDCAVPDGASPGNTHSARTGFYELNRVMEMSRGQLPGNPWLGQQLEGVTNDNFSCNAGYGGSVFFARSDGMCANTGEIPAVWMHEFGHGMDDHDAAPGISFPGEGIADLYSALRENLSCIGRGFRLTGNCTGYGDPCLECDGVRDIDWEKHQSQTPHDVTWSNSCSGVHCLGLVYSEAVWDLAKRDLPFRYGQSPDTALEVTTRLTYLGGGNVTNWFTGANGSAGCSASTGYMQYLAVDDDNGDLTDGTPHMQALFDAFDRHGIACPTPTVQDSGCADRPTAAPVVTAEPIDLGARLQWNAVARAHRYRVYTTDSERACDVGKILIGETTETEFSALDLQPDRDQHFVVAAFGASDSCMGPTSSCTTVRPVSSLIFADGFESGDCSVWSHGGC